MLLELRKPVLLQGNNTDLSTDKFVQSLYAIVLDCLDIPIAEHANSCQPSPEAVQQQKAPEQAQGLHHPARGPHSRCGDAHHQADVQHLREILLGDNPDNNHPAAHTDANIRKGRTTDTEQQTVLETSRPSALLLPPYTPLPPQLAATEAAASASHSHGLTSTPDASGGAPHNRPLPDPPMAAVGLLDALPDVPLRSPPSSGPKGQPPPPSTDVPMIEADTQLNSATGVLHHPWQDHQLPSTDSAAAGLKPMQDSTVSPAQPDDHTGQVSPNLFMTEADLLLDSLGPPPQQPAVHDLPAAHDVFAVHDLPPTGSKPAEATVETAGTAPLTSHPVQLISAASLAARALQRQRSAAAPAILLTAAPAAAAAPAPAAAPARPPTPNRNMYTKYSSVHRRKPYPAKVLLETKVGSLYAIYCLHETQPGRVPVYLPLELLHQLLDIVREAHAKLPCDVVQIVAQLMRKKAFVVGAIRRPPRDSAADAASQQPPNRYAALLCWNGQMIVRHCKAHAAATSRKGCILVIGF